MDDSGRKHDPPHSDAVAGDPADCSPSDARYFPVWLREQLILQFQGIDHSSRSEAVMQIEEYERNFLAVFGQASGGGPIRKSQSLTATLPSHRNRSARGQSDD